MSKWFSSLHGEVCVNGTSYLACAGLPRYNNGLILLRVAGRHPIHHDTVGVVGNVVNVGGQSDGLFEGRIVVDLLDLLISVHSFNLAVRVHRNKDI